MLTRFYIYQLLGHYIQEHSTAVRLLSFHSSLHHIWVSTFLFFKTTCGSKAGLVLWLFVYILPWAISAKSQTRWAQILLSVTIYSAVIPHCIWAILRIIRVSKVRDRKTLIKDITINGLLTVLLLFNPTIPFKPDYGLAILRSFPLLPFRNAFLPITIPGALPLEMPLYVHISYIVMGGIVIPLVVHIYLFYFIALVIGISKFCLSFIAKRHKTQSEDDNDAAKSSVDTEIDRKSTEDLKEIERTFS